MEGKETEHIAARHRGLLKRGAQTEMHTHLASLLGFEFQPQDETSWKCTIPNANRGTVFKENVP
jgi:hypothetical protein